MATVAARIVVEGGEPGQVTGTPRVAGVDRWIFVFMAAIFVVITLVGFIPDSLDKVAAVQSGERPPFPALMHVHAVLMGSFLALLLVQTWLMARGYSALHMQLGIVSVVLVPAIVLVGFNLAPLIYRELQTALHTAPAEARDSLLKQLTRKENILLLQARTGILFPLFIAIALLKRRSDPALHKRLMILATAVALTPSFNRMLWLPTTLPKSSIAADLYTLLAISPMFVWDIVRGRGVHRAYWLWLGLSLPLTIAVHGLWDTPYWHGVARHLLSG